MKSRDQVSPATSHFDDSTTSPFDKSCAIRGDDVKSFAVTSPAAHITLTPPSPSGSSSDEDENSSAWTCGRIRLNGKASFGDGVTRSIDKHSTNDIDAAAGGGVLAAEARANSCVGDEDQLSCRELPRTLKMAHKVTYKRRFLAKIGLFKQLASGHK